MMTGNANRELAGSGTEMPADTECFLLDGCDALLQILRCSGRWTLEQEITLDQDRSQRSTDLVAKLPDRIGLGLAHALSPASDGY